jgi:uncharacterized protein (TIGR03032 family)
VSAARIVLVAAPRSGAGLLQALWLLDDRWGRSGLSSRDPLEEITDALADAGGDWSHRLTPASAGEMGVSALSSALSEGPDHSIDWAPKASLRIPLIEAADPDVRFIRVVRDPRRAVASLVTAWRSGRFASEPGLPGWWGEPWSFPLIPGWPELAGKPLHEVAATQWLTIDALVRDDLAEVDPSRVATVRFEDFIANPAGELSRLAQDLGVAWSAEIPDPLPLSPLTVTKPDEAKWQRDAHETLAAFAARADLHQAFLAEAGERGWTEYVEPLVITREPVLANQVSRPSAGTAFSSQHSSSLVELLQKAKSSLIISTYKSGHVIFARAGEKLDTHVLGFNRPMGMAVDGPRLAIGTGATIESYWNQASLAARVDPDGRHDGVYVPRSTVHTGDVAIHEMDYDADGLLWFVNTRFSCLSTLDMSHSFNAAWVPDWISGLAGEDRCHLNGMAVRDGRPTYVTALARTDTPHGWREHKGTSGVIVEVATNRVVTEGLSMPHSPRWHDGKLWVLQSGLGTLSTVDLDTGEVTQVAELPGFTRGLAFIGRYALIGLSQVRESVFTGLPITSRADERNCGVWVVDTETGQIVGLLRFEGAVQEIFDVKVLPGITWPTIVTDAEVLGSTFVLPPEALARIAST